MHRQSATAGHKTDDRISLHGRAASRKMDQHVFDAFDADAGTVAPGDPIDQLSESTPALAWLGRLFDEVFREHPLHHRLRPEFAIAYGRHDVVMRFVLALLEGSLNRSLLDILVVALYRATTSMSRRERLRLPSRRASTKRMTTS